MRDTLDASLADARAFQAMLLALRARATPPRLSVMRAVVCTASLVLPVLVSTDEPITLDDWPNNSDDDHDMWE